MSCAYPQIRRREFLNRTDAAEMGRQAFLAGVPMENCPFDDGDELADAWKRAYIGCEREEDEQE